jgi:hypothetical protein
MAAFFASTLFLCGCTDADWNNLLSFNTAEDSDAVVSQNALADAAPPSTYSEKQVAVAVSPAAPVDATTSYCRDIAHRSRADAARDGMEGSVQQQVSDTAYNRCMAFYGAAAR